MNGAYPACPLFVPLRILNRPQRVSCCDPSNGPSRIGRVQDRSSAIEDKIRSVKDTPTFLPESTDLLGIPRHFESIGHWKRQLQLLYRTLRFLHGIHRQGENSSTHLFELIQMSLIVGQLPTAMRSP